MRPDAVFETGTFMAFTTRWFARAGLPTYTVEIHPGYGQLAAWTLRDAGTVTLVRGDSAEAMQRLGELASASRPLAYLDAHWEERVPLQDEVDALFSQWSDAAAVVDDFRVPQDPGYGYDTYGGVPLALEELRLPPDAVFAYPAVPATQETGARRGTIYLARGERSAAALAAAHGAGLISEPQAAPAAAAR